jgi:TRAP transporter TAXI family solute receptor
MSSENAASLESTIDRRQLLKIAGAGGAMSFAGCIGQSGSSSKEGATEGKKTVEWDLGTGSEGGASYVIGTTFASFMKQNGLTDSVKLSPVVTSGTLASYRKLDRGQVEMSGTNGVFLVKSPDKGPFDKHPIQHFDKMRQMRGYFTAQGFTVTKKGSDIETYSDLKGKTVFVSPAGSGGRPLFELLYDTTVGLENIEPRYDSWSAMPKMLQAGQIDAGTAFIINRSIPPGHAQKLDALIDWRPLPYPKNLKKRLEEYPAVRAIQVDAGKWAESYTGKMDVSTDPYIYVSRSDYSTDAAYEITKASFEYGAELASRNNLLSLFKHDKRSIELLSSEVPVHLGTYQYFKEKGWWKKFDNLVKPPEAES